MTVRQRSVLCCVAASLVVAANAARASEVKRSIPIHGNFGLNLPDLVEIARLARGYFPKGVEIGESLSLKDERGMETTYNAGFDWALVQAPHTIMGGTLHLKAWQDELAPVDYVFLTWSNEYASLTVSGNNATHVDAAFFAIERAVQQKKQSTPPPESSVDFVRIVEIPPLGLSQADLVTLIERIYSQLEGEERGEATLTLGTGASKLQLKLSGPPPLALLSKSVDPATLFEFSYQGAPKAAVTRIDLSLDDSSRSIRVSGKSPAKVDGLVNTIREDLARFERWMGGSARRTLLGSILFVLAICLPLVGFATQKKAIIIPACITCPLIIIALVALPWPKLLPGTGVYSSSAAWALREANTVALIGVWASLLSLGVMCIQGCRWLYRRAKTT